MTDNTIVSQYCKGEKCRCGKDATEKIEQVIFDDMQPRHPLTQYVCQEHFEEVMMPYLKQQPLSGKGVDEDELEKVAAIEFPDETDNYTRFDKEVWKEGYRAAYKGAIKGSSIKIDFGALGKTKLSVEEIEKFKQIMAQQPVQWLSVPKDNSELINLLTEAKLQIEYLHGKFQETGSGNSVITQIKQYLNQA